MTEKKEIKNNNAGNEIQIEYKWSLEKTADQGNIDTGAILQNQDK